MNSLQTGGTAVANSLLDLWQRFISFLPTLFSAVLVFLIGWAIAAALGKVVEKIIHALHVDEAIQRITRDSSMREHVAKVSFARLIGQLVKWFLLLVFLMAATDILGLKEVTNFINSIVLYLPNVIVAAIILTIAFLLGNFVHSIVRASTRAAGVIDSIILAKMARWAIVIFGLLAALIQLGIATSLVNALFMGLIAAISLAVGLSFGLGGREEAAQILRKMREDLKKK